MKRFFGLSLKEKVMANNFLSLELPKHFKIEFPSLKIQNIFKLNGTNSRPGKKKQKERKEKEK